jgi:D-cysteine desulfhydrase
MVVTLPRTRLAALPTPLVRARRLERALRAGPIYVKRDDLTGFGVAGNKARALEFLVAAAVSERSDVLVVAGSPESNFVAAAAMAASVSGLDCEVVLPGSEPTRPSAAVALARACGGRLHFLPGTTREDLDDAVRCHAERLQVRGRRPYPIPRGGATAAGAAGYVLATQELEDQAEHAGFEPRSVVVATGSGCTQAGLVAGQVGLGLPWHVTAASVSRPAEEAHARVLSLARECARHLDLPGPAPSRDDVDVQDLRGPGFGRPSAEDHASAELALCHEALILDHHYGSKAMSLLRRMLEADAPTPVVLVHTGGIVGALSAVTEGASR